MVLGPLLQRVDPRSLALLLILLVNVDESPSSASDGQSESAESVTNAVVAPLADGFVIGPGRDSIGGTSRSLSTA